LERTSVQDLVEMLIFRLTGAKNNIRAFAPHVDDSDAPLNYELGRYHAYGIVESWIEQWQWEEKLKTVVPEE